MVVHVSHYFACMYIDSCRVYDPAEFQHLQVSNELKELFQHITRYTPQTIDLETRLKPFIPEYIPAIGDIDAFLKVKYIQCTYNVHVHVTFAGHCLTYAYLALPIIGNLVHLQFQHVTVKMYFF